MASCDQTVEKTKTFLEDLWNAIYHEKDGEVFVLDRNWKSWSRILTFYAIYYTFLGLLFWATITLYKSVWIPDPADGKGPALNTRLGQPGLAVYPINSMDPSYKGTDAMSKIKLQINDHEEPETKNFVESMNTFLENSEISFIDVENSLRNKEPVIALNMNKVIG